MQEPTTAYEKMHEVYRVHPEPMPFEWYLEKHFKAGFVFSRPDVFLAARPVLSTAPEWQIKACDYIFHWQDCDCWCVGMIAGNLAKAWDFMPWFLPLMCFQRDHDSTRRLRFYKTESLQRLTLHSQLFNQHAYATA